jgi:hypothetical protein
MFLACWLPPMMLAAELIHLPDMKNQSEIKKKKMGGHVVVWK